MEYSLYKTFACKYRCSMVKAKLQFTKDGIFSIPYTTPSGANKQIAFYHDGFRKKSLIRREDVDKIPKSVSVYNFTPKELIVRILGGRCEWCGRKTDLPKVHQVKKLVNLNPEVEWEALMLKKRRKTLILCDECFEKTQTNV